MSRFGLILFLLLFCVMHLVETKIPVWVLGATAGLAAMIIEGYRGKSPA